MINLLVLAVESQYTTGLWSVIKKKTPKKPSTSPGINSAIITLLKTPINNSNNEDYYNKTQFHVMEVTTHAVSTCFQESTQEHKSARVSWWSRLSLSRACQRWDMHVVGPSEYNNSGTGRNMSPYQMFGVHYTWKKKKGYWCSLLTLLKRESNDVLATRDRYKIYRVGWL